MNLELEGDRLYVRSDSNQLIRYHIFWSELIMRWTCECPDWKYRRMCTGENCKHIKYALAMLKKLLAEEKRER